MHLDKKTVIDTLRSGEPLFTSLPHVGPHMIVGTESEYGVACHNTNDLRPEPDVALFRLPRVMLNGGFCSVDFGHLEYSSPEATNALEAALFREAGKFFVWQEKFSPLLICNNTDWCGNTYGSHESYFTQLLTDESRVPLMPFLVVRILLDGAGWLKGKMFHHGGFDFRISARESYILTNSNCDTTSNRGILNERVDPLATVLGFDRLHLILGDAKMSEVATFLSLAATMFVVEMLERRAMPVGWLKPDNALEYIRVLSRTANQWFIDGSKPDLNSALVMLYTYLNRAKEIFSGRDIVTDLALILWEDTLDRLSSNVDSCFGRLDWVTKGNLLRLFRDKENPDLEWLKSQDLEYHNLDPDRGLYFNLRARKEVERLFSDELIEHAAANPPRDNRACARGTVAQLLSKLKWKVESFELYNGDVWDRIRIVPSRVNHSGQFHVTDARINRLMPDPFNRYDDLVFDVERFVKQFAR